MGLGAVTTYIPAQHYFANLLVGIVIFVSMFWCGLLWMSFGMALLLIASLYPLFMH